VLYSLYDTLSMFIKNLVVSNKSESKRNHCGTQSVPSRGSVGSTIDTTQHGGSQSVPSRGSVGSTVDISQLSGIQSVPSRGSVGSTIDTTQHSGTQLTDVYD